MALTIDIETPLQDDVAMLFSELNAIAFSLTPPEFCHHLAPKDMASPSTSLFIAREDGAAVACGALHRHEGGIAEVKRMYTRPDARGRGVGRKILGEIIALAEKEGLTELVLETGNNFYAAMRIYEGAGFQSCGPMLDYPDSPYTAFYRKPLRERIEV